MEIFNKVKKEGQKGSPLSADIFIKGFSGEIKFFLVIERKKNLTTFQKGKLCFFMKNKSAQMLFDIRKLKKKRKHR